MKFMGGSFGSPGHAPGRRELLDLLLADEGIESEVEVIRPRPRSDAPPPLSFAQELLWLLDRLMPGSTSYNVRWATRISGPLDVPALERALGAIVSRHEVLRTTYLAPDGTPVQVVAPAPKSLDVPLLDLSHLTPDEGEAELGRILREAADRPFDLARDVFSGTLLRFGEQEHVLLLTLHHIMCDGWSRGVFFRELALQYEASLSGGPPPLPPLPLQYADYAVWQRRALEGERLEALLVYWRARMAGAPELVELPVNRPRPPVRGSRGERRLRQIPAALVDSLRSRSQRQGATLFMTLLAAFKVLLHRYSGQEDIVVGSPIASRNRSEVEGLIGLFANALVLRTQLHGVMTFRELLARVKESCLSAYEHQDLPFEKLVTELKPERNLSYTPIFQVMFILQNMPKEVRQLAGLTLAALDTSSDTTKFDLTLSLTEVPDGIRAVLAYNTDLFDATTIERMLGHYQTLLEGIVVDADRALNRLPLLGDDELRQILEDWSGPRAERPPGRRLHHLIEEHASRAPDAAAVVGGGVRLSYGELDERANQLARHLARRGVGPGTMVGICMERSPGAIVAIVAVLKAGGAYVAIDPAYPPDRRAFMIADTRTPVILVDAGSRDQCAPDGVAVIDLDGDWPVIARESLARHDGPSGDDDPAYVVFTSGSTGRPKGVVVGHSSLLNAYFAWERAYDLRRPGCGHLQMAGMSFDVFTGDVARALGSGAKLVLCPMEVFLDPEALLSLMVRERVTHAEFVPAVIRGLMQYLAKTGRSLDFMRIVIAGSDTWYVGEYRELRRLCGPSTRVVNSYGVTEATIDSTMYESEAVDLPDDGVVPIGRPFENTRTYILDRLLQPVPVGIVGELYIGGAGLAQGYLNNPGLTAERFISDPLREEPGARIYRTGDLARYLPDGNIEFLGRQDQQVKVHGVRIELGEIETALGRHPGVREVVVMAREDRPGDRRLVAYVAGDAGLTEEGLQQFLGERLPRYMVPAACVLLERLPLTPNGKVDRTALPAPQADSPVASGPDPSSDSDTLQMIMIWEDVLDRRDIGVDDNFFDIGGHSLLAAQVAARVKQVFGLQLPLQAFFRTPTVRGLVEVLRHDQPGRTWPTLIRVRVPRETSRLPLFCVVTPNGNPLGYSFLARRLPADQPLCVLQSPFRTEGDMAYEASEFEALAASYIEALRQIQPTGPYALVGFCEGAHVAFEMARQLEAQGQEIALLAIIDAWTAENTMRYYPWLVWFYYRQTSRAIRRGRIPRIHKRIRVILHLLLGGTRLHRKTPTATAVSEDSPTVQLRSYLRRYWPGTDFQPPVINARIMVFRVRSQPFWRINDPRLGWESRSRQGVEVLEIGGAHRTVLREPHVREIAEFIGERLKPGVGWPRPAETGPPVDDSAERPVWSFPQNARSHRGDSPVAATTDLSLE